MTDKPRPLPDPEGAVRRRCVADVVLPDQQREPARLELVGGRPRYSVGGEIHEGLRWWRGWVDWLEGEVDVRRGTEICIEMDDGRSAVAVIVDADDDHRHSVRGIGPPPFDVP